MATKEQQEKLLSNLKRWQRVENASVSSTARVIEKTENPIVRQVMEIIHNDSQMHFRVQQLIIDSMERSAIALSPDELGEVWEMIENHLRIEQETITLAQAALETTKGKGMLVQDYLLRYLLKDEEKHEELLQTLEKIKAGMYPYG